MSLIKRKVPKLVKTSEVAARWKKSPRQTRRLLEAHGARKVQFGLGVNSHIGWNQYDVEKLEEKLFGELSCSISF